MNLPPYQNFPRLTSEDLILRKVNQEDIPQLVSISYYDGKKAENIAEAREMQARIDRDHEQGESVHWVIQHNSGEILGTCGYYRGFKDKFGELGCILLPEASGYGYMTKAMRLAISFGFKTIGLEKILASTSVQNKNAIKLLERLNFSRTKEVNEELHFEIPRKDLFNIRAYNSEDKQCVLELFRLNTPQYFHPSEEKHLEEYLEKEARHYLVAGGLGSILAAGGFNTGFNLGKAVRLSWDMVHPEFHGLGIGRELTGYRILKIKKQTGVEKIVVRTTPQAEKFYEKLGFQKVSFEKDFWAPGFDLCELEMDI